MILAVDTSTRTIGVALYDGVRVCYELSWQSQDHHTVELAPAVGSALSKAGIKVSDLGAVAVAIGPGSFTGLRIGLALAKGLAMANRLALVGVPTLDILAYGCAYALPFGLPRRRMVRLEGLQEMPLAAVLQAGRGKLAVGWYKISEAGWALAQGAEASQLSGENRRLEVLTPEMLADRIETPTVICGELSEEERRLLGRKRKLVMMASPAASLRRPSFLAEIGWERWQSGKVDDPAMLAPIYLHYNDPIPAVSVG